VNPDAFMFQVSIMLVTMCLVGGLGHLSGPIIGAVVFTVLPELLRPLAEYKELFSGVVLLGCLLLMPRGLAALADGFVLNWLAWGRRP
jgi:branched-chain amino acid transport system permease protein